MFVALQPKEWSEHWCVLDLHVDRYHPGAIPSGEPPNFVNLPEKPYSIENI